MNIFGKVSEDTVRKLQKKYGEGTWDACNGTMIGRFTKYPYLKLQGKYIREDIITGEARHKMPAEFFSLKEEDYFERKNNNKNDIYHDEEIPFEQWVKWYDENK